MAVCSFNLIPQEAETHQVLWVASQSALQMEFQASQGYIAKPSLKQTKQQTLKQNFILMSEINCKICFLPGGKSFS